MKNLVRIGLLIALCSVISLSAQSAAYCSGISADTGAVLNIKGFLTDVHKKIVNSGEGIWPMGVFVKNDSVDIDVTEYTPDFPEPLEPVYASFMEQMGKNLRCEVINDICSSDDGKSLLSLHSKPFGRGVYGPVEITAHIHIDWIEQRNGEKALEASISFDTLKGPKGTFGLGK